MRPDKGPAYQKSVEILIVGILGGACLVPGGHRQFLFWYQNLIPLAVEMVGLPHYLTFWTYWAFFPVDHCNPASKMYHHVFTILVVVALATIGSSKKKLK